MTCEKNTLVGCVGRSCGPQCGVQCNGEERLHALSDFLEANVARVLAKSPEKYCKGGVDKWSDRTRCNRDCESYKYMLSQVRKPDLSLTEEAVLCKTGALVILTEMLADYLRNCCKPPKNYAILVTTEAAIADDLYCDEQAIKKEWLPIPRSMIGKNGTERIRFARKLGAAPTNFDRLHPSLQSMIKDYITSPLTKRKLEMWLARTDIPAKCWLASDEMIEWINKQKLGPQHFALGNDQTPAVPPPPRAAPPQPAAPPAQVNYVYGPINGEPERTINIGDVRIDRAGHCSYYEHCHVSDVEVRVPQRIIDAGAMALKRYVRTNSMRILIDQNDVEPSDMDFEDTDYDNHEVDEDTVNLDDITDEDWAERIREAQQ